jgi:hypothetical protein
MVYRIKTGRFDAVFVQSVTGSVTTYPAKTRVDSNFLTMDKIRFSKS